MQLILIDDSVTAFWAKYKSGSVEKVTAVNFLIATAI